MTDKAVSALTSLTGANTATGDLIYIVDISEPSAADRSKKITIQELFDGVPAGAEATPAIAAQADQNTGIWFPTADTIAISTGGVERARFTSGGNQEIKNGNLVISTSGKGIDFSSTANSAGTMTSELLADYEEGSWTPVVSGSTSAGSGTYTQQFGAYTKIGNMVYWRMFVAWTAHTGTGNTLLSGLPFTSNTTRATPAVGWFSGFTFTENPFLYVNNNSTSIDAIQMNSGTNASAIAIAGSASIYAAGCYQV
jgi:hypothetical protein